MSLVADYGSDASGSEEESNVQSVTEIKTIKKPSLPSLLPPPKSKKSGPVKIVIDLPKPGKDDDDSDKEDLASKKSRPSSSGLFALLPAPKRTATGKEQNSSTNKSISSSYTDSKTTSTNFIPHTLTKKKSTAAQKTSNISQHFSKIKGKEVKTQSDEDGAEDTIENNKFTESFFPLGPEITNITQTNSDKMELSNIESNVTSESYNLTNDYDYNYNYRWDTSTNSYMEYPGYYYESQLQQQNSEPAQSSNQIDEEVIQKLGGRRGKEGPIIIKEINAADQMADAWQTQMSALTKPGTVGSGGAHLKPTKGQKRKHNLMYLAYQAAAMENDLKEQFAANKKTKRETQAKYGF